MNIIELTEPAAEPISLDDCYTQLRLDPEGSPATHPDDAMLTTMIQTAREDAERITQRCFVERRVRQVMPDFFGCLDLIRSPYREGMVVRYYDTDNALQTLSSAEWMVIEDTFIPRLMISPMGAWPSTYARPDAVHMEYTAGYEPEGSPADAAGYRANIPAAIKDAIKIKVQMLYDELAADKREQLERVYNMLLANHRVFRV